MFAKIVAKFCGRGAGLGELTDTVRKLTERIHQMSTSLQEKIDKLTADVAALTSTEQGAVALLNGMSQQLKDAIAAAQAAGATPDQLAAFDALDAGIAGATADLAKAVTANTAPPA